MSLCGRLVGLQLVDLAQLALVFVVDEVAAGTIRAEAYRVKCAAQLGLVLGVTVQTSQLILTMGKLALVSVLAETVLLKGTAKFSLVARGVDVLARCRGGWHRPHGVVVPVWFRYRPVQLAMRHLRVGDELRRARGAVLHGAVAG